MLVSYYVYNGNSSLSTAQCKAYDIDTPHTKQAHGITACEHCIGYAVAAAAELPPPPPPPLAADCCDSSLLMSGVTHILALLEARLFFSRWEELFVPHK